MTYAKPLLLLLTCLASAILASQALALEKTLANADDPIIGIWVASEVESGDAEVLRLLPDGRGVWVTRRFGDVRDNPLRWKRGEDWLAIRDHARSHDAIIEAGHLVLTRRGADRRHTTFSRAVTAEHRAMLPQQPEPSDIDESAVGAWVYRSDGDEPTAPIEKGDELVLLVLDERGIGGLMGAEWRTAIGGLLRWTREGEVLSLSLQDDVGGRGTMQATFVNGSIELPGSGEETLILRRVAPDTADQFNFSITPAAPTLPRRDYNQGGLAYYSTGATEAIVALRGEQIFEIGAESEAPAHVQEKLGRFREIALPKWNALKDINVQVAVSPNGRSIIIHGFQESDGKPLVHFWPDWQNAQDVRQFDCYYRAGGRMIGSRFVYLGVDDDWDRAIWDLETDAWYEAPDDLRKFDLSDDLRWVGISRQYEPTIVRIGRLAATGVVQDLEFELDGRADDVRSLRGGAFLLVKMHGEGIRIYSAAGELTAAVESDWRLGARLDDSRFYLYRVHTETAALAHVEPNGALQMGGTLPLRRPFRASPSDNYVLIRGARTDGDPFEVHRTPPADSTLPLPPHPHYGSAWITWDADGEAP
ncbi:MAG: hypothetical protein ACF8NJ_10355 [Phycisphaerales bacterium JB038]